MIELITATGLVILMGIGIFYVLNNKPYGNKSIQKKTWKEDSSKKNRNKYDEEDVTFI